MQKRNLTISSTLCYENIQQRNFLNQIKCTYGNLTDNITYWWMNEWKLFSEDKKQKKEKRMLAFTTYIWKCIGGYSQSN
jgi:hypothetical protein